MEGRQNRFAIHLNENGPLPSRNLAISVDRRISGHDGKLPLGMQLFAVAGLHVGAQHGSIHLRAALSDAFVLSRIVEHYTIMTIAIIGEEHILQSCGRWP